MVFFKKYTSGVIHFTMSMSLTKQIEHILYFTGVQPYRSKENQKADYLLRYQAILAYKINKTKIRLHTRAQVGEFRQIFWDST